MKAMVITGFGGPEVFKEQEMPKPKPKCNEVLVKVYATSINPVDFKIRKAGAWAGVKPPAIIGYDASGVVEEVGDEVRDFKVGDEVYYTPEIRPGLQGTYAEYHVANESIVAKKPKNLSHVEAASVPLAAVTAWDAVVTRTQVQVGETVLIHGCGGVGLFGIQLAKAAGAYVIVSSSPVTVELAKQLGATKVINYKTDNFVDAVKKETNGAGVDVVCDFVGGDMIANSIEIMKPLGRMVSIVNVTGNLGAAYRSNLTMHFLFMLRARYKLDALRGLIERGLVKPVIDSVMPLKDVALAHQKLEKGGIKGKIVLQVASD